MTPEQAAAYVHAQSVAATAEIEGMKVTNREREMAGQNPAYVEQVFLNVINKYGLHHNAVIGVFNQANEYAGAEYTPNLSQRDQR